MISLRSLKDQFGRLVVRGGHGNQPVVHVKRSSDGNSSSVSLVGQHIKGDVSIQMVDGKVEVEGAEVVYDMSDQGLDQYHTERWLSLPGDVRQRMIDILCAGLPAETLSQVRELHAKEPLKWWADYHHGAGTGVRNLLREQGVRDDELRAYYPDDWAGYWGLDDFWVAAVEAAAGVRET